MRFHEFFLQLAHTQTYVVCTEKKSLTGIYFLMLQHIIVQNIFDFVARDLEEKSKRSCTLVNTGRLI